MKNRLTLLILCLMPLVCMAETDSLKLQATISEVVVKGSRHYSDVRHVPLNISIISNTKIESQHNSSLLPTITKHVPGLFVTSRGTMGYGVSTGAAGAMSMRGVGGTPTTGMLVTIDGVPQYMGLMGHPIADVCHSSMAESVEVLKGPSSVLYGSNAMGGVINIVTKKMAEDGVEDNIELSYGSFNTLQSSISNRLKRGKFSSSANATYNRTDGHRANMGFEQMGGNINLAYEMGQHWSIAATGAVTHFNASNPGSISSPIIDNDSRITRYSTSLALKNSYDKSSGAVNIFYNAGRHRINDGYSPDAQPLDYRFNSHDKMWGVALYQTASIAQGSQFTFGVDYLHFGGKAWNRYLTGQPDKTTADKSMEEAAAYASLRQAVSKHIILDAGLRLDHHSHAGTEWIPQGGVTFLLSHNTQAKAMVSKGFRFPTIREMYMFPPQNPDLKPESMITYELSLQQSLQEGKIKYGATVYYIDGKNMIQTQPVDGRPMNVNVGKVENWGVELSAEWNISQKLSIEGNYSYLDMRYPVVAAPKHKLYAAANLNLRRWHATSGVQYIDGLITQTSPLTAEKSFVLWDCNIEYDLTQRLRLFAQIDNILDTKYQINAGYPMPGTTFMGGLRFRF